VPVGGPLGDAEHRRHAGAAAGRHQIPHRGRIDRHRLLRVAGRIDRPGQGELGENGHVAPLRRGGLQQRDVPGQVSGDVALGGHARHQQHPHRSILPR